jgi:CHAT domain-containing protein
MRFSIASNKAIIVFLSVILMLGLPLDTINSLAQSPSRNKGKSARPTPRLPQSTSRTSISPEAAMQPALQQFRAEFAEGRYEMAAMTLNDSAGHFYDQNAFDKAMPLYLMFANFADPFITIDPSDRPQETIRKSLIIKDVSRNYAKFMLNTLQVRPNLCKTTNCMELGWQMTERVKSRLLRVDLINAAMSRLSGTEREQVQQLINTVKAQRTERNRQRIYSGNLLGPTVADTTIEAIDREISKRLPEYTELAGEVPSLQRVKDTLADNETFLSFLYTNNRRKIYVFKLEKNQPIDSNQVVIKTEMLTEPLYNSIESMKEKITDGASLKEISGPCVSEDQAGELCGLSGIYSKLIAPLRLTPHRRLIVATDLNLSALPFDIIPMPDDGLMMDHFDITYVPSATVFYHLRQKRTSTRQRTAAFQYDYAGFGYSGEESNSLIHTETEIANAARNFKNAPNVPNATEDDIYNHSAEITDARFLHFATHNYFEPGVDASFYLVFGPRGQKSGHLTSQKIVANLRNRSELTVLSSCETAQANDNYRMGTVTPLDPQKDGAYSRGILSECVCSYGESFSNLSGAFFAAGSKRLLLTQWKIRDDALTEEFISKFFWLLSRDLQPSEALKDTKRKMRDEPPMAWAGFMLAGD